MLKMRAVSNTVMLYFEIAVLLVADLVKESNKVKPITTSVC